MKKLGSIIILYNSKVQDSIALNTLSHQDNDIFICDNSTEHDIITNNQDYCNNQGINYHSFGDNVGLSKAYNYQITKLKEQGYDYIITSDSDTIYNDDYLNEVITTINNEDYDVIIPRVIDNEFGNEFSPNVLGENRVIGINSGTCSKISVFDNWQFNEKIFLYFTDTDFYENNVNKNHLSYKVMDAKIHQNLSTSVEYSPQLVKRLKMMLDDASPYYKSIKLGFIRLLAYRLDLVLRYFVKTKKLSILGLFFYRAKKRR